MNEKEAFGRYRDCEEDEERSCEREIESEFRDMEKQNSGEDWETQGCVIMIESPI